jgi:hypothetical protein
VRFVEVVEHVAILLTASDLNPRVDVGAWVKIAYVGRSEATPTAPAYHPRALRTG